MKLDLRRGLALCFLIGTWLQCTLRNIGTRRLSSESMQLWVCLHYTKRYQARGFDHLTPTFESKRNEQEELGHRSDCEVNCQDFVWTRLGDRRGVVRIFFFMRKLHSPKSRTVTKAFLFRRNLVRGKSYEDKCGPHTSRLLRFIFFVVME